MTDGLIIFSTCSSEEEAKRLAQVLVEEKLAGCVNVIGASRASIDGRTKWSLPPNASW